MCLFDENGAHSCQKGRIKKNAPRQCAPHQPFDFLYIFLLKIPKTNKRVKSRQAGKVTLREHYYGSSQLSGALDDRLEKNALRAPLHKYNTF